ncbi:MAG: DNA replication and repair protein RecF [Bifidobacteriaceae bacterium]|jgi:DNA replication and repair protein RecF|nr:DNA replication and repair protein RecF [Bifidobacteriaceae bacterium]
MYICQQRLYNYRNFNNSQWQFRSGINVLYGNNGVGKSNILEAIDYVINKASFKTTNRLNLIKYKEKYSLIQLQIKDNNSSKINNLDVEIRTDKEDEKLRINQKRVTKTELSQFFISSIYTPILVNVVYNGVTSLRSFLDNAIIELKPKLFLDYKNLKDLLYQRALILKTFDFNKPQTNDIFHQITKQYIKTAAKICFYRLAFLKKILPLINKFYKLLNNSADDITIDYISRYINLTNDNLVSETQITNNLTKILDGVFIQEKSAGQNLIGPHRDKIVFMSNSQPISVIFSTGQTQIFCLALILAIHELKTKQNLSYKPSDILLLDDILASLDNTTIVKLFKLLSNYNQVFITNALKLDIYKLTKLTFKEEINELQIK